MAQALLMEIVLMIQFKDIVPLNDACLKTTKVGS